MSRRPVDKTAQNQQTLKSLVKLVANKTCADCKRNKHPRWASWNLGVFVCIRCSGIHRGMGTHISRVKSVDLDAWTDEQLQSVLLWGNARANKYWESKLAPGHIPSEAKIENFIRTKYESKRWVMDGPMPDPSTLDADGDDDVEKAKLDRSASQRATSSSSQSAIGEAKRNQSRDLICDSLPMAPPRPNTTEPAALRSVPPKAEKAPPKHIRPGESLLGLDFLGGGSSTSPVGPASALEGGLPSGSSRPDLKQSILSLYSSAPKSSPKPTPQSQNATQHSHARAESFGAPQGPDSSSQLQFASKEITDAFGGLKFDSTPASSKSTSNFPGLSSYNNSTGLKSSGPGSGGSFFDPPAPKSPPQKPASIVSPDGFGDFLSSTSGADISSKKPAAESLSADLFDFSGNSMSMASQPPLLAASATSSSITSTAGAIDSLSAFNLSSVTNNPAPTVPSNFTKPSVPLNSGFANMDAWGSTDAWSASNEASTTNLPYTSNHTQPKESQPPPVTSTDFNWGGGGGNHSRFSAGKSSPPVITQDEDFGGWNSSEPVDTGKSKQVMTSSTASSFTVNSSASKPVTNFSGDDLFSNVWE